MQGADFTANIPMIIEGPASATLDAEKLEVILKANEGPGTDSFMLKNTGKLF